MRWSLLAAFVLILVAGCREQETGPVAVSAIGAPPRLVNPNREPLDTPSMVLLSAAAQGLVRFDSGGEIEPALAQRWIVSDDGLRYTFRLAGAKWRNGQPVTAEQVVLRLRAAAAPSSRNPLKPILGAVHEIEAMTDDVLEISLKSPRPNFLHLLAQPEMAIVRNGEGSGPYGARPEADGSARLTLPEREEEGEAEAVAVPVLLRGDRPLIAVARFREGEADLVLGGTIGDLPLARAARAPGAALRFDPVTGLFGLAFTAPDGLFQRVEARQALAMAIDRQALVARFAVPGLQPRQSLLPPGVEGLPTVFAPTWIRDPLEARRTAASGIIAELTEGGRAAVRVAMPDSPGHRLLFAHLRRDWAAIGVVASRVGPAEPADLRLIDEVAPAGLASWYLRRFSCQASLICDPAADEMMAAARIAPNAPTRRALLGNADRILAGLGAFIPLAAPVRWSLVSPRLNAFRPNVFGRHPVDELIRRQP